MRIAHLLLFIFLDISVCSGQTNFFIGYEDSYSILLNRNISTKQNIQNENVHVDYYILREDNVFQYMLSITKVKLPSKDPTVIYTEDYREKFLSECGCEILTGDKVRFNNFDGIKYLIKATLDGKVVKGFSVSTIVSEYLFTVNFFALESKLDSFVKEYDRIMNSLVFNR